MRNLAVFMIFFMAFSAVLSGCVSAEDNAWRKESRQEQGAYDIAKAVSSKGTEESRVDLFIEGRRTAMWIPPSNAPKPWPLIIYSHGYHGCNDLSDFLMEALAQHGYLVVAPDHPDAYCGEAFKKAFFSTPDREANFSDNEAFNPDIYRGRVVDINILIEKLSQNNDLKSRVEWDNIGLIGHSLGGYTVLGMGGAWPEWKMPNVKAILAVSPLCTVFMHHKTLKNIDVPVMYQGGTWDGPLTEAIKEKDGCYEQMTSPTYFVNLRRAGHFAWTDIFSAHHDTIILYSQWFFDYYMKDKRKKIPEGVRQAVEVWQK